MDEVRQIINELKEYRAELVYKNYPMSKINEMIIKWEDWLNNPEPSLSYIHQLERFRHREEAERKALEEYSERARYEDQRANKISKNIPPEFDK